MSSWLIIISVLWLSAASLSEDPVHAIYLSLTELELTQSTAEFNVKVFSDDLRDALKNHNPSTYQPAELHQLLSFNEDLTQAYFDHHLQLTADGTNLSLHLVGHNIEGDAHFINFQTELPDNSSELTINASFLMELFPTQMNVVKVNKGSQMQYLKFNHPARALKINF